MEKLKSKIWKLDNQDIPIVEEYLHLGIPVTFDLDLYRVSKDRSDKGLKALFGVLPLIRNPQIPIWIRIKTVKGAVVPVLTFGGELWGMDNKRAHQPQIVLDKALRAIARLTPNSLSTSSAALGLEYGITPIAAMSAAARTRARKKFPTLRTVIADLIESPPVTRKRSWVSETNVWLQKYGGIARDTHDPTKASKWVKTDQWEKYNLASNSKSSRFFVRHQMEETNHYLKYSTCIPSIAAGIESLSSIRVGVMRGAIHLALIGAISPEFRYKCPCCGELFPGGETPEHILMECSRWAIARDAFLGSTIGLYDPKWYELIGGKTPVEAETQNPADDQQYNVDEQWCPKKPQHLDVDLIVPKESDPAGQIRMTFMVPTCVLMALFLGEIMPIRAKIIRNLVNNYSQELTEAAAEQRVEVAVDLGTVPVAVPDRPHAKGSQGRKATKKGKTKRRIPLRKRKRGVVRGGD